jgi:putative phosphoribosyl transferase
MARSLNTNDPRRFADRRDAGRQLAERLGGVRQLNPVVVGLAPNGMPIAAEIARVLGAPLDTVAVAPLRIGETHQDRVGTAADGGVAFFDDAHTPLIDAESEAVDAALIGAQQCLERRGAAWHQGSRRHSLQRRAVVLVGETLDHEEIAAAACAVRDRGAAKVIYAAPQVRLAAALAVGDWVDQIVCLETVEDERSPSLRPGNRQHVCDDEIHSLLRENDGDQDSTETRSPQ